MGEKKQSCSLFYDFQSIMETARLMVLSSPKPDLLEICTTINVIVEDILLENHTDRAKEYLKELSREVEELSRHETEQHHTLSPTNFTYLLRCISDAQNPCVQLHKIKDELQKQWVNTQDEIQALIYKCMKQATILRIISMLDDTRKQC